MTWLEELEDMTPLKPIETGSEYDPFGDCHEQV